MAQKIDGRVAFADLLRVFAMLAAIVLTLAMGGVRAASTTSASWQVFNLYAGLTRWCMPVYTMLSGMFMLDPKAGSSLTKLFFRNCLRLLIALLFWGGVYAVVEYVAAGGRFSWWGLWSAILNALRGNTHSHLWPIYIFLGLYLVAPILRAFLRGASRGGVHYFLILAFLFVSLLPMVFRLWPNSTAVLHTWYDKLQVQLVLGYVGYFVAGYYLREYTIGRITEAAAYILGVLGAIVTVWGTSVWSRSAGAFTDIFYDIFSPNVVFFSIAVVVLFRYVLGVSEERSRRQRLSGVAREVFGMYLVHAFFLMLLDFLDISVFSFAAVASVPVLAAFVFLCSFGLAWLIYHIPFLGRWLI